MKFLRVILAGLAAASVISPVRGALAAGFDGNWNVVLSTTVGKCEPAIPAGFAVKADDILASTESALRADGAVERSGNMWVRFTAGPDNYRAQGKLGASSGSGTWSSGSRYCGGKWSATRAR